MMPVTIFFTVLLNLFISFEVFETLRDEPADPPSLCKVFIDSQLYAEYTFTPSNLIGEEKSKYQYVCHHYNGKNQLVSSDHYNDFSMASSNSGILKAARMRKEWVSPANTAKSNCETFEYDGQGQLIKSTDDAGTCIYTHDDKRRIIRQTWYRRDLIVRFDYTYDRKGNLIRSDQYELDTSGNSRLAATREYAFDNKPNPYRSFRSLMVPGRNTNINNITREVYTLHLMANERQVTDYEYEYNDRGFPVTVNRTMEYAYR